MDARVTAQDASVVAVAAGAGHCDVISLLLRAIGGDRLLRKGEQCAVVGDKASAEAVASGDTPTEGAASVCTPTQARHQHRLLQFLNGKDAQGKTPVELAQGAGHTEAATLLHNTATAVAACVLTRSLQRSLAHIRADRAAATLGVWWRAQLAGRRARACVRAMRCRQSWP